MDTSYHKLIEENDLPRVTVRVDWVLKTSSQSVYGGNEVGVYFDDHDTSGCYLLPDCIDSFET